MAEAPIAPPEDKPAETADAIIHAAVFDVALKEAKAAIIAQYPGLALPVLQTLLSMALNWVGTFIYTALARLVTFTIIDLQTGAEKDAYLKAEGALRTAHLSGDAHAIDQAVQDYKAALARIIHFDGIAPV